VIRAKHRTILDDQLRTGAELGLRHAFKHAGMPRALERRLEEVVEHIVNDQWNAISEFLDINDEDYE